MNFEEWYKANQIKIFANRPTFKTLETCLLFNGFGGCVLQVRFGIEYWYDLHSNGTRHHKRKIRRYNSGFVCI